MLDESKPRIGDNKVDNFLARLQMDKTTVLNRFSPVLTTLNFVHSRETFDQYVPSVLSQFKEAIDAYRTPKLLDQRDREALSILDDVIEVFVQKTSEYGDNSAKEDLRTLMVIWYRVLSGLDLSNGFSSRVSMELNKSFDIIRRFVGADDLEAAMNSLEDNPSVNLIKDAEKFLQTSEDLEKAILVKGIIDQLLFGKLDQIARNELETELQQLLDEDKPREVSEQKTKITDQSPILKGVLARFMEGSLPLSSQKAH